MSDLTLLKLRVQRYPSPHKPSFPESSALRTHIMPPMVPDTPSPSYSIHYSLDHVTVNAPGYDWLVLPLHSSAALAAALCTGTAASHAHPHFRCPPPTAPLYCLLFRILPLILHARHIPSAYLPAPFLLQCTHSPSRLDNAPLCALLLCSTPPLPAV